MKKQLFAGTMLLLFFSGLVASGISFYRHHWQPAPQSIEEALNRQRFKAMEEAARKGESTYSFTTDRLPVPLQP